MFDFIDFNSCKKLFSLKVKHKKLELAKNKFKLNKKKRQVQFSRVDDKRIVYEVVFELVDLLKISNDAWGWFKAGIGIFQFGFGLLLAVRNFIIGVEFRLLLLVL